VKNHILGVYTGSEEGPSNRELTANVITSFAADGEQTLSDVVQAPALDVAHACEYVKMPTMQPARTRLHKSQSMKRRSANCCRWRLTMSYRQFSKRPTATFRGVHRWCNRYRRKLNNLMQVIEATLTTHGKVGFASREVGRMTDTDSCILNTALPLRTRSCWWSLRRRQSSANIHRRHC